MQILQSFNISPFAVASKALEFGKSVPKKFASVDIDDFPLIFAVTNKLLVS